MSGPGVKEGGFHSFLLETDAKTLHKMKFVLNAIEKGWTVRKCDDSYIFTKKHEGKKEVFTNSYLDSFVREML